MSGRGQCPKHILKNVQQIAGAFVLFFFTLQNFISDLIYHKVMSITQCDRNTSDSNNIVLVIEV